MIGTALSWLGAGASRVWGWLAAGGVAAGVVIAAWAQGRRAGRLEAEGRALGRDLEASNRANQAAADYRGDGAARRLRDGTF